MSPSHDPVVRMFHWFFHCFENLTVPRILTYDNSLTVGEITRGGSTGGGVSPVLGFDSFFGFVSLGGLGGGTTFGEDSPAG